MFLEDIAKQYGMVDYYEQRTGKIYKMSEAKVTDSGYLLVPVYYAGNLLNWVRMEAANYGENK